MHLEQLQHDAWAIADAQGHHEALRRLPLREATLVRLALVHTEVSEIAQEVKRHGVTVASLHTITHEVADTMIRLVDMLDECSRRLGRPRVNLSAVVEAVFEANTQRPYKYGTPDEHPAQRTPAPPTP